MPVKYEVGQNVMLRSGGPVMVVVGCGTVGCTCAWLDEKGARHSTMYAVNTLMPIKLFASIDGQLLRNSDGKPREV